MWFSKRKVEQKDTWVQTIVLCTFSADFVLSSSQFEKDTVMQAVVFQMQKKKWCALSEGFSYELHPQQESMRLILNSDWSTWTTDLHTLFSAHRMRGTYCISLHLKNVQHFASCLKMQRGETGNYLENTTQYVLYNGTVHRGRSRFCTSFHA